MEQCPICYSKLEVRDCTPCDDCGWNLLNPEEVKSQKNIYRVYEVYKGLRLTLCNFCAVDFGSYKPEYFGFTNGHRIGFQHFHFIKEIQEPNPVKDKFCPECSSRLTFLNFLFEIRKMNSEK